MPFEKRSQQPELAHFFCEPARKRALAIRRAHLPADHPDVVAALNNVGTAHFDRNALDESLAAMLEAIALREGVVGPDHPEVTLMLANLVSVYEVFAAPIVARRAVPR